MNDIFSSVTNGTVTAGGYITCTLAALACGILAAVAASVKNRPSKGFVLSLVLLPVIVETVIVMVNGNVGTGVAVMGAFSLVRFRSVPGKAKDITLIFLAMTAGLSCAAGYVGIALIFTLFVSAIIVLSNAVTLKSERLSDLRITVPESLSFTDAFEDIFEEYTKSHSLTSVKTASMGSLYKLTYTVEFKDKGKLKEFIDRIRCRNGNLEVSVTSSAERSEEL